MKRSSCHVASPGRQSRATARDRVARCRCDSLALQFRDDPDRIDLKRAGNVEELDNVQPPLTSLELRHKRLGAPQAPRERGLGQAGVTAGFRKQLAEVVLPAAERRPGHAGKSEILRSDIPNWVYAECGMVAPRSPGEPRIPISPELSRALGVRRTARLRRLIADTGLPPEPLIDLALEMLGTVCRRFGRAPDDTKPVGLATARWQKIRPGERSNTLRRAALARWARSKQPIGSTDRQVR